ncbi:MAG: cytidine deaminase [Ginsengibacter sp.]
MTRENFQFSIKIYDSSNELNKEDAQLLSEARNVTKFAYAPYSHFKVGAFARLLNGQTVSGTNQENASYPAGICAERTLLSTASSLFPGVGIETVAIAYHNMIGESKVPISPCGICRQSFVEFQHRTGNPIRLLLSGQEGQVQVIDNAADLLPLVFEFGDEA